MIYRLVEHYNDDIELYENNKIEECFICFELVIENNVKPISLKRQCYYLKFCGCDGWIHKNCLDEWCLTSNKCPICRTYMTKNNEIVSVMIKNNTLSKPIYLFLSKHIFRILRFLFVIFTFFCVIETINNLHNLLIEMRPY
jgi:hypothetical protein